MEHYFQRGGLRRGNRFRGGANATWPFATLDVTAEHLTIVVGLGPFKQKFDFDKKEVKALALQRGLFSIGLRVEHARSDYPPFILFWTFAPRKLSSNLQQLGYPVGGAV